MISIIIGSFLISLLHALIPNHWLPVLTIGKSYNWTLKEVTQIMLVTGLAHALSTIMIGIAVGLLGLKMAQQMTIFTDFVGPVLLIFIGFFFIFRHHRHLLLNLKRSPGTGPSKMKIIGTLVLAMSLSPCMEIEGYFLMAGTKGLWFVSLISTLYLVVSVSGMVILVRVAYKGLLRLELHRLEHHLGLITGSVLVITGLLSLIVT